MATTTPSGRSSLTALLESYHSGVNNGDPIQLEGLKGLRDDPVASKLKPTSGKLYDENEKVQKEFAVLSKLRAKQLELYGGYFKTLEACMSSIDRAAATFEARPYRASLVEGMKMDEDDSKASQSLHAFFTIEVKISKCLDPSKLTDYSIAECESLVQACTEEHGNAVKGYFRELNTLIIPEIKTIKNKVLDESKTQALTPIQTKLTPDDTAQVDKNPRIPERKLDQWVYDVSVYYVRPDNVMVSVDNYIQEFSYMMEYDTFVMPIYTMDLVVTENVYRDFKDNFESLKFYINVKKYVQSGELNHHVVKEDVVVNEQIIPLNPQLLQDGMASQSPLSGIPSRPLRLDFVSKKNVDLNGKVKSKVYNSVTMLDVITSLITESYNEQVKAQVSERELLSFTITPPDNTKLYDQVILDPGTVAQNIKQLQEKYGVYRTGIRVMMDTISSVRNESGTAVKYTPKSMITVTDKGGNAPGKGSIEQVLVEIMDRNSKMTLKEYESGSTIDKKSNIAIIRTMEAYTVDKRNAAKIIDGDSVRVMSSSQNNTIDSECDISMDDLSSPQRTYWGKNDNPYNLTQLQDTIREKLLSISVQCANVDAYMFVANLKYVLKFYNQDDTAYSGEYRLKAVKFYFNSEGSPSIKEGVSVNTLFYFTNIPDISVNGVMVKRDTYVQKVERMKAEYQTTRGKTASPSRPSGAAPSPPMIRPTARGGPYLPKFAGSMDYNGVVIPKEVPPGYRMSQTVEFSDVYTTKDGTWPERGNAIVQSMDHFCYAQKFANRILDPIFAKYGKCVGAANGRMNSFYRYHVPAGGATNSAHLWALAADLLLKAGGGDALTEPFWWIATQSNLDFDQVILEGDGKTWRWIHVGMNGNSTNRREILLIPGIKGGTVRTTKAAFSNHSMAKWSDYRSKLR